MQVIEVDRVHAEPLQARLATGAHALGPRIDLCCRPAAGWRNEAELGGQDDLVAAGANRAADEPFIGAALAVGIGRVDQRDAEVEGAMDRAESIPRRRARRSSETCPCSPGRWPKRRGRWSRVAGAS